MCGRYSLKTPQERIGQYFQLGRLAELRPRYNIAPSQPVPIVRASEATDREMIHVHWGLIPKWSKDPAVGNRMINARSETAAEKPSFREAMRYRRCLVPADGFYEWQKQRTGKQPYHIVMADGDPFAFAGLWEHWQGPDGEEIESCAILTPVPNRLMADIHLRMPAILPKDDYEAWLDPTTQAADRVQPLLRPYPEELMKAYPVSRRVNSPENDDAACIEPIGGDGLFGRS